MLKQFFLFSSVFHLLSVRCAEHDNTAMVLSRIPTILREICAENRNHELVRQLLICMEPAQSAQETIQKLGLTRLMRNDVQDSNVECEALLRKTLFGYAGSLVLMKNRGVETLSPKTTVRLAKELCDSVLLRVQPAEHPYNDAEEKRRWLSPTKNFPEFPEEVVSFNALFISLIEQHWQSQSEKKANPGYAYRQLAKAAYVLAHPDSEQLVFGISSNTKEHRERYGALMGKSIKTFISSFPALKKCFDWECYGTSWVKWYVEIYIKRLRSKIIPETDDMHPLFKGRFLSSRFFDVRGMRVHSSYYEKLLSDHLDYIKASGNPHKELSDNGKVHTLFEEYFVVGSEERKKDRIAFVATKPGKSSFMAQGLGRHAENPVYSCLSDPDDPIPSNITAVAYKGNQWSLKPGFVELTLALGCADGNVVFINYSEFWKKATNPSGIEKKVFKITDGPIQCIDRGQLRGDWIFATDDSLILWRKKTKERWVYTIPEIAKNQCTIQAVRNYDCFIVYALSNGTYGTIAPYTQDECDIITVRNGRESSFWDELCQRYR